MQDEFVDTSMVGSTRSSRGGSGQRATRGSSSGGNRRARPLTGDDLKAALRDFASARPQGWSHDDWLVFLEWLRDQGHNIEDRDQVGLLLEKERLNLALEPVHGLGPQRRGALVNRYATVWNLRNADVDEIARVAKISRGLAEQAKQAVSA